MADPDGPPDVLLEQWGHLNSQMMYLLRLAHTAGWRDGIDTAATAITKQSQEYRSEVAALDPDSGPYVVGTAIGNILEQMAETMHARVLEVPDPERPTDG